MQTIRLAVRVYINGVKQSEERISESPEALESLLPRLAEQHADLLAAHPGHIEIEFLDEPDINQRFFRIGTDKSAMVIPIEVKI